MNTPLKILHFADIQYNVRNKHFSRKVTYEHANKQLIDLSKQVDVVLISGDVFEHYDTNNVEEQLFIDLIDGMLSNNSKLHIYCICGNHDQKQRNVDFDNGSGERENYLGSLEKLAAAINNERFTYFNKSGIYDTAFEHVKIAAWDTNAKYIGMPWSPWTDMSQQDIKQIVDNNFVIEMFHDCVWNAINFDGEVVKGDNESRTRPSEFHGHFIALGDIHMPSIVNLDNGRVMSYPSSTVTRDFGEGDYWNNGVLTQQGNLKHGVNLVYVNVDTKNILVNWQPIEQLVHLHTFKLDNDWQPDMFVAPHDFGRINKIKIVNNISKHGLSQHVDSYVEQLLSSMPVANVDFLYGMQAITELSNLQDEDADSIIVNIQNPDKLQAIANEWCTKMVTANPAIADNDKQLIVDKFCSTFKHALESCKFDVASSKWLLHNIKFNQFMALGPTDVNFDDPAQLIRLSGNNGNGKTTLFRAFKWVVTGLTDTWQNAGATKQNSIALFNDKLTDIDVIEAELKFTHIKAGQAKTWSLHRKLERFWKRNADKTNTSNITKIVETVQLEDTESGQIIDNSTEIADIIYDIFGSIWELSRFVCIDQYQLDSIVMMKSDDFNDWLLDQLGINIFTQLAQQTDTVKQNMFDVLAKPAKNAATLNAELLECQDKLKELEQSQQALTDSKIELQQELGKVRKDVEETSKQFKAIPAHKTVEAIEHDIATAQSNIATLTEQQTLLVDEVPHQLIANVEQAKTSVDNLDNQANFAKQQHLQKVDNINNKKFELQQQLTELQTDIESTVNQAKQSLLQRKSELQQLISKQTASINSVLTNLANQYNNAIQANIDELTRQKDDVTKLSFDLQSEQKDLQLKLSNATQQFDKLSIDVCPTCSRPMTGDASIDAMKQSLQVQMQELRSSMSQIAIKQTECVEATKKLSDDIATKKSTFIDVMNFDLIVSKLEPQHLQAYEKVKQQLDSVQQQCNNVTIQVDSFDASQHIEQSKLDKLTELQSSLKQCDADIANIKQEADNIYNQALQTKPELLAKLESAQQQLDNCKKSVAQYKQNAQQIESLKLEVANLEAELANAKLYATWQKDNEVVNKQLDELHATESDINKRLTDIMQQLSTAQANVGLTQQSIQGLQADIESIKTWEVANMVVDLYRKAVSKKGLVGFVFEQIAASLNAELGSLMSSLHYRIFFDLNDNNALKMIDLIGKKSIRPLRQMSGMQITFAGLSIVHLIVAKRQNKIGNILLIDEISGKLSDGNIINAESDINKLDYRNILMKLLKTISKQRKVIVVDHILDYDEFDKCMTVVMHDNGCAQLI